MEMRDRHGKAGGRSRKYLSERFFDGLLALIEAPARVLLWPITVHAKKRYGAALLLGEVRHFPHMVVLGAGGWIAASWLVYILVASLVGFRPSLPYDFCQSSDWLCSIIIKKSPVRGMSATTAQQHARERSTIYTGGFSAPLEGLAISQFGWRVHGQHNTGIDIAAPTGTAVYSAAPGRVSYAGSELASYGNLVLITHGDNFYTAYAHLGTVRVKEGQHIASHTEIGTIGQTGDVDQPELHFEIREGGRPVDPAIYFKLAAKNSASVKPR